MFAKKPFKVIENRIHVPIGTATFMIELVLSFLVLARKK